MLPQPVVRAHILGPELPEPASAAIGRAIAMRCHSRLLFVSLLVVYTACKPAGPPVVIVGQGQADYLPMSNGEVAQLERGPQGGHHIWVAVRTKNLLPSGSTTSVSGHFPDLGLDVGPYNTQFTMVSDEGGYNKLYGLRFQLDQAVKIGKLLGHPLDLTVTITDPDATVGVGKLSVVLSQTYLP